MLDQDLSCKYCSKQRISVLSMSQEASMHSPTKTKKYSYKGGCIVRHELSPDSRKTQRLFLFLAQPNHSIEANSDQKLYTTATFAAGPYSNSTSPRQGGASGGRNACKGQPAGTFKCVSATQFTICNDGGEIGQPVAAGTICQDDTIVAQGGAAPGNANAGMGSIVTSVSPTTSAELTSTSVSSNTTTTLTSTAAVTSSLQSAISSNIGSIGSQVSSIESSAIASSY